MENTELSKYLVVINDDNQWERMDEITASTSYEEVKRAVKMLKKDILMDPDLTALCAPQIGINLRIFCVRSSTGIKTFLNPMIVSGEGLHLSRETNASFPDKQYIIPRKNKLHVAYQEVDGHVNSETYIGAYAEVVQQMIEMLDGIFLPDYGLEIDKAFDRAKKADKEQIIEWYLDSLKNRLGILTDEIDKDPALREIKSNIEFTTEVLKGEIKPVDEEGNIITKEFLDEKAKEKAEALKKELEEKKKNNEG